MFLYGIWACIILNQMYSRRIIIISWKTLCNFQLRTFVLIQRKKGSSFDFACSYRAGTNQWKPLSVNFRYMCFCIFLKSKQEITLANYFTSVKLKNLILSIRNVLDQHSILLFFYLPQCMHQNHIDSKTRNVF